MNTLNYLNSDKELCRFITCGSVDDGKSTLIGRMLYDSSTILEDHLKTLIKDSKKNGTQNGNIDFALLVDGLESEREQGITIDVAYRYFNTSKRKFIIADTPGHEEYTRNMATGASNADIAIILVDARKGVLPQTKRHSYIASLLGIKQFIIAVNKMDLVDYSQSIFVDICNNYKLITSSLKSNININFIPISALNGDNIVLKSNNMKWYSGDTLFELLDNLEISVASDNDFLLPVQYVNRPNLNFRGFCGNIISGSIKSGDRIVILPSNKTTTVKEIIQANNMKIENKADCFDSITLTTNDEVEISRGNLITSTNHSVSVTNNFQAKIVWMSDKKLELFERYYIKIANNITTIRIEEIIYKKDINTLQNIDSTEILLNDISLCQISAEEKLAIKIYDENKVLGSFILIDRYTYQTVAAGMVYKVLDNVNGNKYYSKAEIELNKYIRLNYPEWGCKEI